MVTYPSAFLDIWKCRAAKGDEDHVRIPSASSLHPHLRGWSVITTYSGSFDNRKRNLFYLNNFAIGPSIVANNLYSIRLSWHAWLVVWRSMEFNSWRRPTFLLRSRNGGEWRFYSLRESLIIRVLQTSKIYVPGSDVVFFENEDGCVSTIIGSQIDVSLTSERLFTTVESLQPCLIWGPQIVKSSSYHYFIHPVLHLNK